MFPKMNTIARRISMKEIDKYNLEVLKKDFDINKFENYNDELINTFKGLVCTGAFSKKEIVKLLNIDYPTYNRLIKNKEVVKYMEQYSVEVRKVTENRLNLISPKALDVLEESLNSDDEKIRIDSAKDILNRTGFKPKEEKNINVNHSYEQTLNQACDMGLNIDEILNADYKEV